MVVAHVLVDGQRDARRAAQIDDLFGLSVVDAEWLLREDSSDVVGVPHRLANDVDLHIRRDGNIDNFDSRIGQQSTIIGMHRRNLVSAGDVGRVLGVRDAIATGRKPAAR